MPEIISTVTTDLRFLQVVYNIKNCIKFPTIKLWRASFFKMAVANKWLDETTEFSWTLNVTTPNTEA